MKDASGKIIYIGKAVSLKKRAASYFRGDKKSPKTDMLISKIRDISYVICSSEAESLLLEAALIKEHKPKYNIELKDDKAYPLLKLDVGEKFATLKIVRVRKNDGARYFGPFTNSLLLKDAVGSLRKIFRLRTCRIIPKKECLNYHLGYCSAPCIKNISESLYKESVKELELFLEGEKESLVKTLTEKMLDASKKLDFETASKLRDRIRALTSVYDKRTFSTFDQMENLKTILALKKEPVFIEAFDVSNIMGKLAVGSMVTFKNGFPYPGGYRRFKIKTFTGIDDYKMMREIVRRHYEDVLDKKLPLPDLVVIDGGKGHLSSAKDELDNLGFNNVPVIGLAKEFEKIFVVGKEKGIILKPGTPALRLLQYIRDEAHRFAIGYHKILRKKTVSLSELDEIPEIGSMRKKSLIKYFGSVDNIKKASIIELMEAGGLNEKLAGKIHSYFQKR